MPPHSALCIRGKTNKQKLSTNLTVCKAHPNYWTNLRKAETKRKKEFNLEAWEKETSNTIIKKIIIMIIKMIKNLENKMKKMQESINKDVEELKNKHTETTQLLKLKIL